MRCVAAERTNVARPLSACSSCPRSRRQPGRASGRGARRPPDRTAAADHGAPRRAPAGRDPGAGGAAGVPRRHRGCPARRPQPRSVADVAPGGCTRAVRLPLPADRGAGGHRLAVRAAGAGLRDLRGAGQRPRRRHRRGGAASSPPTRPPASAGEPVPRIEIGQRRARLVVPAPGQGDMRGTVPGPGLAASARRVHCPPSTPTTTSRSGCAGAGRGARAGARHAGLPAGVPRSGYRAPRPARVARRLGRRGDSPPGCPTRAVASSWRPRPAVCVARHAIGDQGHHRAVDRAGTRRSPSPAAQCLVAGAGRPLPGWPEPGLIVRLQAAEPQHRRTAARGV